MAHAHPHHRPGEPPPVRDEAADTPLWMPLVGLCFLVAGAFAVIWQAATADEEPAPEAAPAAAPEGEPEAAPEPPPDDDHAGHGH